MIRKGSSRGSLNSKAWYRIQGRPLACLSSPLSDDVELYVEAVVVTDEDREGRESAIEAELIDDIFNAFTWVAGSRKRESHDLQLPIRYALVKNPKLRKFTTLSHNSRGSSKRSSRVDAKYDNGS